jgi:C4-dicarboxylate-specific signal transduction histidine kinase
MKRTHAVTVAVVLGVSAMLGTFAASRSAHLGAATRSANQAQIAQREHRLAAQERALRRALAKQPALPATVAKRPQRTVFVRPAPIVVHLHRGGGEREGGDGGGFDD